MIEQRKQGGATFNRTFEVLKFEMAKTGDIEGAPFNRTFEVLK